MKEKLLIIAPLVPLFDRYSGDFRLFNILEMLSKSYDLTYLARERASDTSIDNNKYVSSLENLGIRVYVADYSIKDILGSNSFKAAIMEYYHIAEHYLPRIKLLQPSCPVVIDTVVVHYLRLKRKYEMTKNKDDLQMAEKTKVRELYIYSKADITLTVTDEDARSLLNDNPNITVRILPNVHKLVYPPTTKHRNEIIFVGGFNHDPNIDAVVYFCEDILPRIRKILPEARFTIVGSNPPGHIKALNNDFITVTGHVPSTAPYLERSYVSVAPLRYGAGMKGKIGEAMAHGIPVVTTSIGAEGMGLTNRENILIADSPENFSDAVIELMFDNILYNKIQKNALEHIENNFSPEKVSSKLERILGEMEGLSVKKMSLSFTASFLFNYTLGLVKRKLATSI